jgi:hypothetical protein
MASRRKHGEVILVHWDAEEAEALTAELRKAAWKVRLGMPELREVKADPPTAVVISLRRLPSHGREVADALWYTKWGRGIPIVFVDGQADKVKAIRAKFPDARFVVWPELTTALHRVVADRKGFNTRTTGARADADPGSAPKRSSARILKSKGIGAARLPPL